MSAGNNPGRGNSFPKNPGQGAVSIDETGWYTFRHDFFDDGGTLGAELSIVDSMGDTVFFRSFGTDPIGDVGGEGYGWIQTDEFSVLAFDNVTLTQGTTAAPIPLPASVWMLGAALGGLGAAGAWRRRRAG